MRPICSLKFCLSFIVLLFAVDLTAQTLDLNFQYDGEQRECLVHLPPNYDGTEELPLVLAFHGLTNTGEILMESSKFDLVADTANFIVAFPTALTNGAGLTAWENGLIVGSGADDMGYIAALVDSISNNYSIDYKRVYATGFSMGGFLSNRLACEQSDRFAAIASHSGTIADPILWDCNPTRPFPMMHIHGTSDNIVSYNGNWLGGFEAVDTLIRFWRDHNNCPSNYEVIELPDSADDGIWVDKSIFGPCDNNIDLLLYTVYNHNHSWLQPENDIFSSVEIWNFLKQHELPEPVVGLPELNYSDFKLFPNPTTKNIQFSVIDEIPSLIARVENMYGQQVMEFVITDNGIDVSHLPRGTYLMRLSNGQFARFTKL